MWYVNNSTDYITSGFDYVKYLPQNHNFQFRECCICECSLSAINMYYKIYNLAPNFLFIYYFLIKGLR